MNAKFIKIFDWIVIGLGVLGILFLLFEAIKNLMSIQTVTTIWDFASGGIAGFALVGFVYLFIAAISRRSEK